MARLSRGAGTPEVVVIWWRDIPCQVNAQLGRERQQVLLGDKFQRAVDRAKRKAGITTAHEDVSQWRRVSRPCDDDLAAEAAAEAKALTKQYTIDRLGKLAFRGGFEADGPTETAFKAAAAEAALPDHTSIGDTSFGERERSEPSTAGEQSEPKRRGSTP